jgi:hypothetical protein
MTSEAFPNRRRQVGGPKETKSCNIDYCDESDEEKDRRPNDERMFDNACALGQFFLNPCLCLYLCGQQVRRKHGVRGFMPSRTTKRVGLAVLVALLLVGSFKECSTFRIHPLRPRNDWEVNRLPVQIPYFDFSSVDDVGGWTYPRRDQRFPSLARMRRRLEREKIGDFGGLVFVSLRDPSRFRREIDPHDGDKYEKERKFQVENMDKSVLSPLYWHDDELDQVVCHRPNWRNSYFPNCNDFHEIDLSRDFVEGIESENDQPYDSYRFNHGFYREAWLVNDVQRSEGTVLKTLRGKHDFTPRTMRMVQRDAIIMERLTSSSRIIDMYGHCGTSITVEPISYELELYAVPKGYMKKEELADKYDVNPQNDFTATEKLEMALEMAESLAVLHGYEGGVIVHDDVQLCQWLRTKAGKLVLGDFNRAEIMDWDKDKEAYCKYNNGFAYGNVSANNQVLFSNCSHLPIHSLF